ncbi:hypothetical protein M5362_21405 [Streptomyces sp. Je 1-79]|uniref:hypothetical protein n=1 Tax=Streptomyces sp. Je 1-79 TaxID=2943847 RepID=UPI0021A7F192|nr:hypothetical protein [Streptomyces sp. Je 1-79]MCT4355699.1 hypothetical protein [Streptomyces sp. Je 1-79]
MSFGDPNNPYGQQQGQQPGYGYPQQQGQQPGYGYPQAPPVQQPYGAGGYPGATMEMPGGVKAARVMLWILGILQALMAVLAIVAGGWIADQMASSGELSGSDGEDVASVMTGVMVVVGIIALAFGVWAIVTAAKIRSGGNGLRISGIVYGSLVTAGSVVNLISANVFALISLVMGVLIIVFLAKSDGAAWFKRNTPQY